MNGIRAGRPKNPRHAPASAARRPAAGHVRRVIGFVLRFAGYWLVALVVLALVPAVERWFVLATVGTLQVALRLLGVESSAAGSLVEVGHATLLIVPDCTSLMSTVALASAIGAFPGGVGRRLAGLVAGAALLWGYNVLRLLLLIAAMKWEPKVFDFMHVYLWQTVTVVVVSVLFVLWVRLGQPRPSPG